MTTPTALPQHLQITNGPSKFDLSAALFSRKPKVNTITFTFLEFDVHTFMAAILGVTAEDGSGESWLITGVLFDNRTSESFGFKGYFRTDTRKGWLDIQQK